MDFPYIRHVTDTALTVVFGNEITPQINARVCAFAGAVEDMKIKGVTAVTPTYRAVMVEYCPLETSFAELRDTLAPLARGINPARTAVGKRVEIPVCYGGEYGPDLAALAAGLGLSQNEVIKIHSYVVYPVYMMGFSPGFPYLGGMDSAIAYPRL